MSIVAIFILPIALTALTEAIARVKRFETFRQEVADLERAAACRVNERVGTGQVENVKVMWNDWFQNKGHGIHADRADAARILSAVLSRHAPRNKQKIADAFFGNTDMTFKEGAFTLTYRYRRGPAIDERLLIITQQR